MSKTLFDKVWDAHVVRKIEDGPDVFFIDRHFIHEVTESSYRKHSHLFFFILLRTFRVQICLMQLCRCTLPGANIFTTKIYFHTRVCVTVISGALQEIKKLRNPKLKKLSKLPSINIFYSKWLRN